MQSNLTVNTIPQMQTLSIEHRLEFRQASVHIARQAMHQAASTANHQAAVFGGRCASSFSGCSKVLSVNYGEVRLGIGSQ